MRLKLFSISLFFIFGLVMISSCGKENLDVTNVDDVEVDPTVVVCDLEVGLAEQPPGSGALFSSLNGGTAPYSYLWSTGETSSEVTVNADGTYTLTVTDAEGCEVVESIDISITDPCISFTAAIAEDSPGELSGIVSGGTSPYVYEWSTGELSSNITVSTDGEYTLNVTDAEGCIVLVSYTVVISIPCESLEVEVEENPAGTLTALASGGTAPYIYTWSTGESTSSIEVFIDGVYFVTVTDANGCEVEEEITVSLTDPCLSLISTIAEQPPGSGMLWVAASGGTPPYAYLWSTGEITDNITVASSGTFSVTVIDAVGCETESEITL